METQSTEDKKTSIPKKTFKRETAIIFAVVLFAIVTSAIWIPTALSVLEVIIFPFMSFIGLCFGLDSWSKQIKK